MTLAIQPPQVQSAVTSLCNSLQQQYYGKAVVERKRRGLVPELLMEIQVDIKTLWINFKNSEGTKAFTISAPIPYIEDGVYYLEFNGVKRALSSFFIRKEDHIISYLEVLYEILAGKSTLFVDKKFDSKIPYIFKIIYSFRNNSTAAIMHNIQRAVNDVLSKMPIHITNMNSWVMNRRLIIIDPDFNLITDPNDKLAYHTQKNKEYFKRGWTSIGLADGSMSDQNYILTTDLKPLTPFGNMFHNPQRNLYSTLGMKGDELPNIRSTAMQSLIEAGISRKGWNLFTLFVDIEDNFEDQILVDKRHANKYVDYKRRIICFGTLVVEEGTKLKYESPLSYTTEGEIKRFKLNADDAWVHKITPIEMNVGGAKMPAFNLTVILRRYFKDGTKITNLHANKGVIRLMDLGYAIDPKTGINRPIDVIVSSKAIGKRKNYGQILEALCNTVNNDRPMVVADTETFSIQDVKNRLVKEGYRADGTWDCNTYRGHLKGICGTVFWGVTKDAEDALWDEFDTVRKNGRGLRAAGVKFSHVEIRALSTLFGKESPIIQEVLNYTQGHEDLRQLLLIAESKRGNILPNFPVFNILSIPYVNQDNGIITDHEVVENTFTNENFVPNGFYVELPFPFQTIIDNKGKVIHEGAPTQGLCTDGKEIAEIYTIDKLYIPDYNLRKCWHHDSGKYGLSEIASLINNILLVSHRITNTPDNMNEFNIYYSMINKYFKGVSSILGGKTGEIAVHGMSVRYPHSIKAVATLSSTLPPDTIEIHRDTAKQLKSYDGDIALVIRFPVLGFTGVRPQKIKITDDPLCKQTIRVSGNSLCSAGLDFDGDVIYVVSFHTKEAKDQLKNEWQTPNSVCRDFIDKLNNKAGVPQIRYMSLDEYNITPFAPLNEETHATIVSKLTGVKSHTGPVVALAYNIMRILENSSMQDDPIMNTAVEIFLDKVGNSVFSQKHGTKSLHETVIDAVCTGNIDLLVTEGFDKYTSEVICSIIRSKALSIGIKDLEAYHKNAKENKWSTVINRIVREENKIYFASRATLELITLLKHLEAPAVDIPSKMLLSTLRLTTGIRKEK